MEDLVTIASFTYPSDIAILRGRLESEGIRCVTKDETTVQVHHFYSQAVGGIKLQVPRSDAKRAIRILIEAGHLKEEDFQPSSFWAKLDRWTGTVPGFKMLRVELRSMLLVALILFLGLLLAYWITLPSKKEYLTEKFWCIARINYQGKDYSGGSCRLRLDLAKNGSFLLIGFGDGLVTGDWSLQDEGVRISRIDTLKGLFLGEYRLERDGREMTLSSERTRIHCSERRFR